jgi:tRNA-binding EMAP/Myf-like protein
MRAISARYRGVCWYGTGSVGTHGVVVGRVIKVRPHPYGDHIWLADLDIGTDYQPQVVWGGVPIVESGSFVPVALPGSQLPGEKIRRRRYRNEVSEGMLCSLAELGWDSTVDDRVALLRPSANLRPGDSLDNRSADWRSIVVRDQSRRNLRVLTYEGIRRRISWTPVIRSRSATSSSTSASSSRAMAVFSAWRPWR